MDITEIEARPFVKHSITTAAGNAAGTTLIDAALTEPNTFWDDMAILIRSGTCAGELKRVTNWTLAGTTLTVNTAFSAQIPAGVRYSMYFPTVIPVSMFGGMPITQVDLIRVLGVALSAVNPVIAGIFDPAGNRMPAMDVAARPGFVDVIDRAARLLGIVYGNQAQLQQVAGTLELITQDTGLNTNPERWLHDNHWGTAEVTIAVAGAPGQQNLGAVVPGGVTRRIRTLRIRHTGTNNTVVTVLIAGGATIDTYDVPAQSTRIFTCQDGAEFAATQQPAVQTSDVTGGGTYVTAVGVEA